MKRTEQETTSDTRFRPTWMDKWEELCRQYPGDHLAAQLALWDWQEKTTGTSARTRWKSNGKKPK
jgi:hypothetical protein